MHNRDPSWSGSWVADSANMGGLQQVGDASGTELFEASKE